MRPFLTARWTDLLLVTWKVPDALLAQRLPDGLTLDRHDGAALVSLVAFDFEDTRVRGIRWPGLVRFPELNLRFYVRDGERRGVCFVREYVPSALLAAVARGVYNEPYRAVPYFRTEGTHSLQVGGRRHRIAWSKRGVLSTPHPDSLDHFLKEHSWGFTRGRDGRTREYRVDHPVWRTWPEVQTDLDVDLGVLYGAEWRDVQTQVPLSTLAAEGSAVAVYSGKLLSRSAT